MPAPLRPIDDEQCPYIASLVVYAGEALHIGLVLRNKKNGLIHIPGNLRVGNERRIGQPVLRCSMPYLVDAWQVGTCGRAQPRFGHGPDDIEWLMRVENGRSPGARRRAGAKVKQTL